MQSYKDLDVYQLAHRLAIEIHRMTLQELPSFERYEEGSQIRRSSKAITAAIVEGFGRKRYQQEFVRKTFETLLTQYEELGKKLYRLREAIVEDLKAVA